MSVNNAPTKEMSHRWQSINPEVNELMPHSAQHKQCNVSPGKAMDS